MRAWPVIAALSGRVAPAFLVFLSTWLFGAASAPAAEAIEHFNSVVQVAKDGELTVTETIRVNAEGREIRHGLYRDFPFTFKDAKGLHEVTFSLTGITRDGRNEPYHTERQHGVLRIYAGDPNTIVPRGQHTYVFRYRTGRQIRWFDGKPELDWNVTGNFWHFPILAADYRLELPSGVRPVRWTAFTGRLGARGTNWRGDFSPLGALTVAITRPLAAGEGLTVAAEIPAGAVEPPSQSTELWYEILDNRAWIFGGIGFVLVFAYYFAAWKAVGRDPKGGIVIPLFHPPAGISPGLANYIHNWGFGREKWRAFTAAALSMAVRGLLKFDRSGGGLTLKETGKKPDSGDPLPGGERAILTWLDGHGGNVVIDRASGTKVAELGAKFTTGIEAESRNKFFRRNLGYVIAGFAMTAVVVLGEILFGGLQDEDIAVMFGFFFAAFFIGIFIVPVLLSIFRGRHQFAGVVRGVMSLIVVAIFVSLAAPAIQRLFPDGFGAMLPKAWALLASYPFPLVLLTAFAALNGLFSYLMRAPTALGRPVMDQLNGFRLYLETAEKDRLNMQAPEITADRFEALLPYAVALDVEKPWAQAFDSALRRANPGDADPMRSYQPTWSSGGGWSSGGDFASAVSASVVSVSSAFASAEPASSGSGGGGGGSGGGGGGGGGGGW
jgi:predicted membrane protein DUF2207